MKVLRQAVVLLALTVLAVPRATAVEQSAADVLPPTAVLFAEVRAPQELVNAAYNDDLVRRVESLDGVRKAMEQKQYLDFKAGIAIVESQMGLPWRQIVGRAMGGGLAIAVDAKTQGVVVLARAGDEAGQAQLIETLAKLASLDAKNKGNPDPVEMKEYRGIKTYTVDKGHIASAAPWLVATNNADLEQQIVDRILDKPQNSLAADAEFAKARGSANAENVAWGYVNTDAIRKGGVAQKLFGGQAENLLVELLFGGILSTLHQTPYVTFEATVADRQVRLTAAAPHDPAWAGESRTYYFGPQGKGAAPTLALGDETILAASAYRDVAAMWRFASDLVDEQANEELAKADSQLTTLFSGKDFGEDILGAFGTDHQLVIARQTFAEGQPAPAIKLPALGIVATLKDPAKMQADLRRTFQNLIGFFNVVGAMNGQPQLEFGTEKTDSFELVWGSPLPDADAKDQQALKLNYNFSPAIAFSGNRFVLATTKELARSLATSAPSGEATHDDDRVTNSGAELRFDALRKILADNREQLIAQNMLKDGHNRQEAETAIGDLLELVSWFDHAAVSLDATQNELRGSLEISMKAN